jgi:myo-inositol 2-dehydrogenase/D-chiro-inositol 1-dehydrogenase
VSDSDRSGSLPVAILGAGRMGRLRATAISRQPNARLVAVFDTDREACERLAEEFQVDAVASADAAIARAEAVVISTPSSSHAELVMAAAGRGKAVFCEKPLALNVETATAAVAAVEAAGVPSMVGFSKRFDPARRALENSVRAGEIGRVEMVLLTNRDPNTIEFRPLVDYLRKLHDTAPYGLIRESTVHDFDTARALLGDEPTELFAIGSNLSSPTMAEFSEPDTVSVTMRTASGSMCHINGAWRTSYGYDQRIEVVGSTGMLRLENEPRPPVVRYDETGGHTGRMFEGPRGNFDYWMFAFADAYPAEIDHFIDCVLSGRTPMVSVRDGLRAQVLVEAAVASLRNGSPVAVPA